MDARGPNAVEINRMKLRHMKNIPDDPSAMEQFWEAAGKSALGTFAAAVAEMARSKQHMDYMWCGLVVLLIVFLLAMWPLLRNLTTGAY